MSKYRVYYMKPESFSRFIMGTVLPRAGELDQTHVFLIEWTVTNAKTPQAALEAVFIGLQAECWSPNGEARPLIEEKGLTHTSMSVGDVIEDLDAGAFWIVADIGFHRLNPE